MNGYYFLNLKMVNGPGFLIEIAKVWMYNDVAWCCVHGGLTRECSSLNAEWLGPISPEDIIAGSLIRNLPMGASVSKTYMGISGGEPTSPGYLIVSPDGDEYFGDEVIAPLQSMMEKEVEQ